MALGPQSHTTQSLQSPHVQIQPKRISTSSRECVQLMGAWETVKTRASDRISDCGTAAMITDEMFDRVDNILENA